MLVNTWEAMNEAIPRISAQEWMDGYTVMVVASPYVDKDAREGILTVWRGMIAGGIRKTLKENGKTFLTDGTQLFSHRLPLRETIDRVKQAFGRNIRD